MVAGVLKLLIVTRFGCVEVVVAFAKNPDEMLAHISENVCNELSCCCDGMKGVVDVRGRSVKGEFPVGDAVPSNFAKPMIRAMPCIRQLWRAAS